MGPMEFLPNPKMLFQVLWFSREVNFFKRKKEGGSRNILGSG
jgi:hypothetical protein